MQLLCDTYCQPLSIVDFAGREKCIERVVSGDNEASEVDEEFASNVEKDQEEVEPGKTEEDVDFRYARLLLKIVEHVIFGKLGVYMSAVFVL